MLATTRNQESAADSAYGKVKCIFFSFFDKLNCFLMSGNTIARMVLVSCLRLVHQIRTVMLKIAGKFESDYIY